MSPLLFDLLLESLAVPFGIAGFLLWAWNRRHATLCPGEAAGAIVAIALLGAWIAIFGIGKTSALGARGKMVMLLAAVLLWCLASAIRQPIKRSSDRQNLLLPLAVLTGTILWIGWPLMQQGEIAPLLLPLILGAILASLLAERVATRSCISILAILAFSLAGLFVLARTLSYAQLSLAAAAVLAALAWHGKTGVESQAAIAPAVLLAALATVLAAFAKGSLEAFALLLLLPIFERVSRHLPKRSRVALLCASSALLPAAAFAMASSR